MGPTCRRGSQAGDLAEAMRHYQRAFDQGDKRDPHSELQGAAPTTGQNDQALAVYDKDPLQSK